MRSRSPEAARLILSANAEYLQRNFERAYPLYLEAYQAAMSAGDGSRAVRALNNLGGCSLAMLRYREALGWYGRARSAAAAAGDLGSAAAISLNLSSLHLQLGDPLGAEVELRRGIDEAPAAARGVRAALELQQGKIETANRGVERALPRYFAALREAELAGDRELAARVWNTLGLALLRAGQLESAEEALLRAFYIRRLTKSPDLIRCWQALASLRLAQGDLAAAERLAELALSSGGSLAWWSAYYGRARVRMRQDRWSEALDDLRRAIRMAQAWRLETLPGDVFRIGVDTQLQDLYTAFVEATFELHRRTGRPGLPAEAFSVAEQARAASLRSLLIQGGKPFRDAPEYGSALARLREAQSRSGDRSTSAVELWHRLAMLEVQAGLARTAPPPPEAPPEVLARRVQRALGSNEALLGIEASHPLSYLFVVTRGGVRLQRLPSERRLEDSVQKLVAALQAGEGQSEGQELYQHLFAGLDREVLAKTRWFFTLSGPLLSAPLAACHDGESFLVERHELVLLPSAHFLLRGVAKPARSAASALFVGDPIYNAADPRAGRATGLERAARLQLVRLAGSGREIRAGAAAWHGPSTVLDGAAASRASVLEALQRRPAVLHFATHVVTPGGDPAHGSVALSLNAAGAPELLPAVEIAALDCPARLVVLSACGTAGAESRPGTGLLGLTRAWIAAGAETVVATLWPVSDSGQDLFQAFYARLRSGSTPAEALRQSQIQALRSGGARSPSWAAYVLVWGG